MIQDVENSLTITRAFDVSVEQLYQAWTDPAQVVQWMGPGEVKCVDVQIDLKVGGAYRIHMVSDEGDHVAVGEFLEITPNQHLKYTWAWESQTVTGTHVTVEFRAKGKSSELTLVHEDFPNSDAMEKHTQGWNGCLEGLTQYLN
jgi:uncharacterized protein YndB with AHSA1/START domain